MRRYAGLGLVRRLVTGLLFLALCLLPVEGWAVRTLSGAAEDAVPMDDALTGFALCIPVASPDKSKPKTSDRGGHHACDFCIGGCCVPSLGFAPAITTFSLSVALVSIAPDTPIDRGYFPVHALTLGPRGPPFGGWI